MNLPQKNNGLLKLPTTLLGVFAHEDDEVLGPGGTLIKNAELGGTSHVICFGGSTDVRTREFLDACNKMGVTGELLKLAEGSYGKSERDNVLTLRNKIVQLKPEFIITHRKEGDYHRDHQIVSTLTRTAGIMAQTPSENHLVKGFLYIEGHSLHQNWHIATDITKQFQRLLDALNCHKSQLRKNDNYYIDTLRARTKLRGVQAGCDHAEAFVFEPLPIVGSMNRRNIGM